MVVERACPWYCDTTAAATSDAHRLDLRLLAGQVGAKCREPGLGLLEVEAGVVVPLRGLLGLLEEGVDSSLDVVDFGVGERGARGKHRTADRGDAQGRQHAGGALPAVQHERSVSSLS